MCGEGEIKIKNLGQLPPEVIRRWVYNAKSCIGHSDTAAVLSQFAGCEIKFNRENITLNSGDILLVAQLQGGRLPEGAKTLPEGSKFLWKEVLYIGSSEEKLQVAPKFRITPEFPRYVFEVKYFDDLVEEVYEGDGMRRDDNTRSGKFNHHFVGEDDYSRLQRAITIEAAISEVAGMNWGEFVTSIDEAAEDGDEEADKFSDLCRSIVSKFWHKIVFTKITKEEFDNKKSIDLGCHLPRNIYFN